MSAQLELPRPYGPILSVREISAICLAAAHHFKEDSPAFLDLLMRSVPEHQQPCIFHNMWLVWIGHHCPLKIGKALISNPLFKTKKIEEILDRRYFSTLAMAFRGRNFEVLTLLQNHPESNQIDAEYIAEALNNSYGYDHFVNAIVNLLSPALLREVMDCPKLSTLILIELEQALLRSKETWGLWVTALSAARIEQNALTSLKKLVQNSLFDPRVLKIVKSFF